MTSTRYFEFWSYCLIASGFFALAASGGIDRLSLILFGTVLTASYFLDTARINRRVPRRLFNLLGFLYLLFYYCDYRYLSRSFVLSTIHLILFVAAVKLVSRSSDRDYVFLYLLSFAELLASSTLTVDMTFGIILFIFLLSIVNTLVLFEMRRGIDRAQREGGIGPVVVSRNIERTGLDVFTPFPFGRVFLLSIVAAVTIALLAIPFFLLLPRISLGFYRRQSEKTQWISGFSEHVRLGEIGSIKESDAVVMRV